MTEKKPSSAAELLAGSTDAKVVEQVDREWFIRNIKPSDVARRARTDEKFRRRVFDDLKLLGEGKRGGHAPRYKNELLMFNFDIFRRHLTDEGGKSTDLAAAELLISNKFYDGNVEALVKKYQRAKKRRK